MKKWIIVLLGIGLVSTAMARFNVYQVTVQGKILEVKDGKGTYIENGIRYEADKYVKIGARLRGYLLEDEDLGWISFILIENGLATQNYAAIYDEVWLSNTYKLVNMIGYRFSLQDKGIRTFRLMFDVDVFNVYIDTVLCGNYSWTVRETSSRTIEKYSVNMKGSGHGNEDGEHFPIHNIGLRLDSKSSNSLYAAFIEAGGLSNESAGIAAVTAKMREIINKKARIDNSMAVWGP